MARGWESKGVEEQQAEARSTFPSRKSPRTPEEIAEQKQLDALQLSRSRIVEQLRAAQNPNYRQALEAALADLDRRLAPPIDSKV